VRENLSINQRPVVDKDVKSAAPAKDPSTTREEHPPCQGWEGALREGCQRLRLCALAPAVCFIRRSDLLCASGRARGVVVE
jgi:hypothetical protein